MYQNGNQSKMHPLTFVNRRRRHCSSEKKLTILFLQSKEILNHLFVYIFIKSNIQKEAEPRLNLKLLYFVKQKTLCVKKNEYFVYAHFTK